MGVTIESLNAAGSLTLINSISTHFNSSTTTVSWVFSAYALTMGAFIIIAGKFCDLFGAHNVYVYGVFGMAVCVMICALIDDSIIALIVFRALQGLCGSVLVPSSFAITSAYYQEPKSLEMACKGMTVAFELSAGLGLLMAGAFAVSSIGYKGFYWYSAGSCYFVSVSLFLLMDPIPRTEEHDNLHLKNLDYGGSIMLIVGLILVILGLTQGGEDWKAPVAYVPIVVGGVVCIAVVVFEMIYIQKYKDRYKLQVKERRQELIDEEPVDDVVQPLETKEVVSPQSEIDLSETRTATQKDGKYDSELKDQDKDEELSIDVTSDPTCTTKLQDHLQSLLTHEQRIQSLQDNQILPSNDWRVNLDLLFPREILKIPNFLVYFAGCFLMFNGFTAILAVVLQYHVYIEDESPLLGGVKTLALSFGLLLITVLYQDKIAYRFGLKNSLILSGLLATGGTVWLSRMDFRVRNNYWKFELVPQIITGIGIDLYFLIYTNAILSNTPLHLQGLVSAILQTSGQIGIAIGNAIIASILGDLQTARDNLSQRVELHGKMRNSFYVAVASFGALTVCMCFVRNVEKKTEVGAKIKIKD